MTGTAELVASVRAIVEQFVPDGFRDEDGVWWDGPLRKEALDALAELERRLGK